MHSHVFKLRADHKLLLCIVGKKYGLPATAVSRLQRWAVVLSGYDYASELLPSHDNCLADCLSRHPLMLSAEQESAVTDAVEDNACDPIEDLPVPAADVS